MVASRLTREVRLVLRSSGLVFLALTAVLTSSWSDRLSARAFQAEGRVATRSAASYAVTVAPDSIVAIFGSSLVPNGVVLSGFDTDPSTPDIQLPTVLGDITVEINGRSARFLYVSPFQINCVVPSDLEPGTGSVVVRHITGHVIATGDIEISAAAPAIFTANGTGEGVPAALYYRIQTNGALTIENVFEFANGVFVPRPVDLGPHGDQVYLVLFLTGGRQIEDASDIRVMIGGHEFVPDFVGPAPGFVGLEQLNFLLPRHLAGRLKFALTAPGYATSNICDLEVKSPAGAPPTITGLNKAEYLPGETVEISGAGFDSDCAVIIADANRRFLDAKVTEATATTLKALVPFGAGSGNLIVRTARGEASRAFRMRTSMSGVVQAVERQPDGSLRLRGVRDVTIRVAGLQSVRTNESGAFLVADVPVSNTLVFEVDGTTNATRPFARESRQIAISAGRDNQYQGYIELHPATGAILQLVQGETSVESTFDVQEHSMPDDSGRIERAEQSVQVIFETMGSTIQLPDGTPVTSLTLSVLERGRIPADLPPGHYSSTIAQLTPSGAQFSPGGRLTFPNTDSFFAGSAVTLFRFDQTAGSSTRGQFVDAGTALVSADGTQITTAANAIKEATYYLVSIPRTTTTLYGNVLDDGRPARGALVHIRGQSGFALSDQNGAFIISNVPLAGVNPLLVEVSLLRPDGTVDRTQRSVKPGLDLTSILPAIDFKTGSRPPLIVAPKSATIEAGKTSSISFVAQPGSGGAALQNVSVSGASFSSVNSQGNDTYVIQLAPAVNANGNYTLVINATDAEARISIQAIALEVKAPPGNATYAESRSLVTHEDVSLNVTLTGSGGNQYRITIPPVHGVLGGVPPNVVYAPEANFNGLDSFSFVVGNGSIESVPAKVSISVRRINDPSRLVAETKYSASVGRPLQAGVHALDVDLGQTLSLEASGLPAGATLSQLTSSSWMLAMTPAPGQIGDFPVTLTLRDDWVPPATVSQVVTISVQPVWAQTAGPVGGDVRALTELDGVLFAGTNGNGVFRSTDRGTTWSPVNNNLTNPAILSLTATGSFVFAGTGGSGVFRSSDYGMSWTRVNDGLTGLFVSSLVSSGSTIFAGTNAGVFRAGENGSSWFAFNMGLPSHQVSSVLLSGNALFAGTNIGVFRLTNPEGNWSPVNGGLSNLNVHCLAANGTTLFAGTSGGVFRMPASGSNWTQANSGLSVLNVVSLAATETAVFAGTSGGGVFRSSNQGANWNQASMTPSSQSAWSLASTGYGLFAGTNVGIFRSTDQGSSLFRSDAGLITAEVTALATSGSQVFAGSSTGQVFRTADQGTSWSREDAGLTAERVYALASSGNLIFAGTDSGVFRSGNQGASWSAANNGLANLPAFALTFSGTAVFAGTSSGVFRSIDQGSSWVPANSGLTNALVLSLTVNSNALIAGTDGGAFRSVDNGASWTPIDNGLIGFAVDRLVTNGAAVLAGTAGGVFRTIDQGANWVRLENGLPVGRALSLTSSGNSVLAGFGGGGGVYRTTDQGATWSQVGTFLSEENVFSLTVTGGSIFAGTNEGVKILFEAAPTWIESGSGLTNPFINAATVDGNTFIVGVFKGGVFRSTDDGSSWAPSNAGLPGVADVRALTTTSSGTFAGVAGSGIFVSQDRGLSWAARSTGLTNLMINTLTNDGTAIWAATEGGVFRSADNGQTWSAVNAGLTRLNVLSLTFNSAGLFAGTDNGLFKSTNQGNSWVAAGNGLTDGFILSLGTAPNGLSIVAGTGSGLFRSTNQGQSWTRVVNGIPEGAQVLTLATSGSSLFAGTVNGYFVSRDNGSSWEAMNRGLTNLQIGAIAVRGNVIIAGARAWSVFKSNL